MIGDARLVPSWPSAGWLVLLALTSQVLGWLLITISLPRLPAALTSLLLTVQPVGSVALGALILGEAPSALQFVGVVLVLCGLLVATLPEQVLRLGTNYSRRARTVVGGDVAARSADEHHGL